MTRVLFIQPPVEDFFFTPARSYPVGLLSLATVLEQAGCVVRILNCPAGGGRSTVQLPPELRPLGRYYQPNCSPFRLFGAYYRFGAGEEIITREIRSFRPDIAGISLNFTPYLDAGFRVAELIKQVDPRIIVVAGGRAATAEPSMVMRQAAFDYLIRGEGEFSLRALCVALRQDLSVRGIPGLCARNPDGSVRISRRGAVIDDVNALPLTNHALIDAAPYQFRGRPLVSLLASRGCARGCRFCAIQERFRFRRVNSVLEEMSQAYAQGIRHFNFEDDTINLHPQFEFLLDEIHARFRQAIRISFMNGLLSRGLTDRVGEKLARAGLTHADFSVGSMVARLRVAMNRRDQPRQIFRAARILQSHAIPSTVHFIIGYPGQTVADAVRDIRQLAGRPVLLGPSMFYPVPGSAVFPRVAASYKAEGSYRLMRSSAASYTHDISRDQLMSLFSVCRIVNYMKEHSAVLSAPRMPIRGHVDNKEDIPRWLIEKLVNKQALYRATRSHKGGYDFKKEDFADAHIIRKIIKGLDICTVANNNFCLKCYKTDDNKKVTC